MVDILIQSAKDIALPWTHWFFYGPTGSGKTTAAATFPSPLFLVPQAEGSELTLAGLDVPYIKLGRDADGNQVRIRQHMNEVLALLERQHATMRKALAENDEITAAEAFPWETIVVESLTHYCAMLQDDIGNNGATKMDQQKWGLLGDHLRTVHSRLRALDCHVVFTSLAKVEGEGDTAEGMPDVTGKASRTMPSACDAIGYCEAISGGGSNPKTTHKVHFRQHRAYPARTRFRKMPSVVEDFDYAKVAKFIAK